MKPHSLRKILWLSNLGLAAAVVGVGAWFALEVRPAVAKVIDQGAKQQPSELKAMRKDYENMRVTGLKWTPKAPVDENEVRDTILRPDYAKRKPTHWIFSGPLPPAIIEDTGGPIDDKPPAPEGLDVLGTISLIVTDGEASKTILFNFTGGKSFAFGLGDFVRASADDARRFRISDIVEVRPRVWEVRYDVFGDDPKKPERAGTLLYDESTAAGAYPSFLRPEGAEQPIAEAPGAGTGAPADGTAGAAVTPEGAGDGETEDGPVTPTVIDAGNKPVEDLTLQDLKPTIHVDKSNSRRRAIEFDSNSYRYFRGKKAKAIAETVKTQVHKDPTTGRVVGLRITGFDDNAPADVFDVRRGDILVSINGQKITSRSEAISFGQRLDPDKLVTVVIDRNGRNLTYKVDPRDPQTKRKVRYFENLR